MTVYINGIYYNLSPQPIHVTTDKGGSIIIVETITNLNGTTIDISLEGIPNVSINPMSAPFQKLVALDSKDALKNATVQTGTKAGGIYGATPPMKPLVSPDIDDDQLDAVAKSLSSLKQAYNGLDGKTTQSEKYSHVTRQRKVLRGILDSIEIPIGNMFRWCDNAYHEAIDIVYDAATDAWAFVTTIAGEVYHAILDTVDAVVGAAEWIFNKIKTAIEDLIALLELLLNWNAISNTKRCISNLMSKGLDSMLSDLRQAEPIFDSGLASIVQDVNDWAGIQNWGPLAPLAHAPADSAPSSSPVVSGSASHMLAGHFQDNAGGMSVSSDDPSLLDIGQELLDDLIAAVKHEGELLDDFAEQLAQLAGEVGSLSVVDMLKRLIALIADVLLDSVRNVVDALLKILVLVAESLVDVLKVKVHIPVISDILNALGIDDFSILDIISWVAAAIFTLGYEILHGSAPFTSDEVDKFTSAEDLAGVKAILDAPSQSTAISLRGAKLPSHGVSKLAGIAGMIVFEACHSFAAVLLLFNVDVQLDDALAATGDNPFALLSTVVGVSAAVLNGVGNILGPSQPLDSDTTLIQRILLGEMAAAKLFFATPLGNMVADDKRGFGALVNVGIMLPQLYCTCRQIMETATDSDQSDDVERFKPAFFIDSTFTLQSYFQRGIYAAMVNTKSPGAKAGLGVALTVVNVTGVALQAAEAITMSKL
jgi:hypothetical protein